jgi:hypothetical protein
MFGEFNDPFELVPGNFGATLPLSEAEKFYSHTMHDPSNYYDYYMDVQSGVRGTVGVICFTSEKDNLLMWAHYAKNHAGVCIEFDANASFFNGQHKDSCEGLFGYGTKKDSYANIGEIKKVRYSNKRPLFIDPKEILNDTDFWFIKSEVWSYEKEYRILLPIEHAIYKKNIPFYKIDKTIIKSVTLGCQMTREMKAEVYSICSLLDIQVKETFVNSTEFKLDIVDYHPDNQDKQINIYNLAKITKW